MARFKVTLGHGDCDGCGRRNLRGQIIFVDSGLDSADYAICVKCYDKIHGKVSEVRRKANLESPAKLRTTAAGVN